MDNWMQIFKGEWIEYGCPICINQPEGGHPLFPASRGVIIWWKFRIVIANPQSMYIKLLDSKAVGIYSKNSTI